MINIKLKATLKSYSSEPNGLVQMKIENGLTVKEMLKYLNIPWGAVGFIIVNGNLVRESYTLCQADDVKVYPIFGGG